MIYVKYKGRLGNNLFQYALGRILAEELGQNLVAEPIPGFLRTYEQVDGKRWNTEPLILTGQQIPFSELLIEAPKRDIILDGYFQQYEYYKPFKERIRQWFLIPEYRSKEINAHSIAFIRRGDFYGIDGLLPFSYYENTIRKFTNKDVWISSDDPYDPFVRRLCSATGAKMRMGSGLEDFAFGMAATEICISCSTYSWWIAFLSNAQTIYFPVMPNGNWYNVDADLSVSDEPRFKYIRINERYRPTWQELFWLMGTGYKRKCVNRLRNWKKTTQRLWQNHAQKRKKNAESR